ncbi:anaphase-promoting complex, subunit 10-domain-containing protein [Chlamydoabsidia padenii]|nr:anaphase-promoting complex, subunit 10-domain-containing protein [Chlamydoabsidia padenii]
MSDQEDYRFNSAPDITLDDALLDNDTMDTPVTSRNYPYLMDDDEPYLLSGYPDYDNGLFGGERLEDDRMEQEEEEQEEEEEEEEDGDRLLEEGERERQAVQIYHSTHPDIEQQQTGGREIDEYEAIWKVSTFRPDWGVEKMKDNNPLTYWQSDCPNPRSPHTIDLYFHQATFIKQVSIFIDFLQDESYSPKEISIRGGTTYRDLHEIACFECGETVGWKNVDLSSIMNEPLRVFQLQIAVLSTHLNGRDVHVRQIKVYSIPLPYLQEKNVADGQFKARTIFHRGLR